MSVNPTSRFLKYRGLTKAAGVESLNDVALRDLLVAVLHTGEAIHEELAAIRELLEDDRRLPADDEVDE
jgi:hypothetical protein